MISSQNKPNIILVRPRIYIGDSISIGPGKIGLLKQVAITHSISGAARAMGIPYKRAWSLIDTLNQGFSKPVVETLIGGKKGGGAMLTPLGQQLIERYEALEKILNVSAQKELEQLYSLADLSL